MRFRQSLSSIGLLFPALTLNLAFFLLPIGYFFILSFLQVRAFQIDWSPTSANYAATLAQYGSALLSTVSMAFLVAVVVTIVGFAYAYACRFCREPLGTIFLTISLVTLFGGYLAKLYAWRIILGDNGILNSALMQIGLISSPLTFLLYNQFAVVLALTHYTLPLAILPLYGSLRAVEDQPIAAARDLGASRVRIFVDIVLPQCGPGLFSAFALTLLFVAGDAIAPRLLGGTSSTMIGMFIQNQFGFRVNAPMGAALAFTVIVMTVLLLGVITLAVRQYARWRLAS